MDNQDGLDGESDADPAGEDGVVDGDEVDGSKFAEAGSAAAGDARAREPETGEERACGEEMRASSAGESPLAPAKPRSPHPEGEELESPASPEREVQDLELVARFRGGDLGAVLSLENMVHGLRVRSVYVHSTGTSLQGDDVKAALLSRISTSPQFLNRYHGRGTLRGFLAKCARNLQKSQIRKERRQGRCLQRHYAAGVDHAAGRATLHSCRVEVVRGREDRWVRDAINGGLHDAFFKTGVVGAPVQATGACRRGLLRCINGLGGMHSHLLIELKRGSSIEEANAMYRRSSLWMGHSVEDDLIDLYRESGGDACRVVEYGVECVIDLIDSIGAGANGLSDRWNRDNAAAMHGLAIRRMELGRLLRGNRAA